MSIGRVVWVEGSRCWPLSVRRILGQQRRRLRADRARLRGRALDELLADQRLRPDRAGRVIAPSPRSPARSTRRTTAAFWSGVTSIDSILPTLTPAIFTSSPGITEKRC